MNQQTMTFKLITAHCVQDKEVKEIRVTTESYVYLGKNDLDNFNEPDSVKKEIEKFVIHPKWNPFDIRYEADIAIIIMDSDVKYSDYIIPICLWKFSDHLHEVVGQQGSLAGLYYLTISIN